MKIRKVAMSLIMISTITMSSILGNGSISYAMEQNNQNDSMNVHKDNKIVSVQNPIVDASTEAVTFSYIYFGSYPQSEVTGEALTDNIINADYVSDDAVIDGTKYRRLEHNNKYRYFKYEPIKWRVIWVEDEVAMLRSESILDCKPYNKDNSLEHGYSTSWVRTTIRCWLNGYEMYENKGFLQSAFSKIGQKGIIDTYIAEAADFNLDVERSTKDKVILLLKWFMLDNCWNQKTLVAKDTEYATAVYNMETSCNEWMINNDKIGFYTYIDSDGIIHSDGLHGVQLENQESKTNYYMNYSDEICGVCPTIQLDLSCSELWMTEEEYAEFSKDITMNWIEGNVNGDESIDLKDAQLVLRVALNIEKCSKVQMVCGDMDGDGIVTLSDAQIILKRALRIGL